ncbi:hypothetical protein CK623_13770 [Vandammella animalimorsus]|uniref:Uncharacterized protein n=1 Tax=Vandammella animalimorsus TaxID=2029117 RepID=A0A2A2AIA3_9BURK|nr:hypothetical protein CK623_13770 [Vandammella animalimorsus]
MRQNSAFFPPIAQFCLGPVHLQWRLGMPGCVLHAGADGPGAGEAALRQIPQTGPSAAGCAGRNQRLSKGFGGWPLG